jgi:quinol-cytochrome oxidoreductase complex cytochrome b subunit
MRKHTIIVLILFVYMSGMTIWGYRKGAVSDTEALLGFIAMCVILTILWFIYRKKQRYRDNRKKNL